MILFAKELFSDKVLEFDNRASSLDECSVADLEMKRGMYHGVP